MFGSKSYNFAHFTKDAVLKDILQDRIKGPRPGERAPAIVGRTLDGEKFSLAELRGRSNLLVTFGSATCPATVSGLRGLNRLYRKYAGTELDFLFVYIREAHPGERVTEHRSRDEKQRAASLLRDEGFALPILVDDLQGSIHREYGTLPNASYLIDQSGRIAFRAIWTRPAVLERAIRELLDRQREGSIEHAVVAGGEDSKMPVWPALLQTQRTLERGGRSAIHDFERELGIGGSLAVSLSRWARPVAEEPRRTALFVGLTAAVIAASVLGARYLRSRAGLRPHMPYDSPADWRERLGLRSRPGGDYEAVGI